MIRNMLNSYQVDFGQVLLAKSNKPIELVLDYVESYLPRLSEEVSKKNIRNEPGITQILVRKLNANLPMEYPFFF